jgi:hypothetical protein
MRLIAIGTVVAGFLLASVSQVKAWGDVGHMTVAKLAWDQLNMKQRMAAYQTLQKLPSLERFLEAHPKPANVSDQEWLFLIAADWPDWLKDFKFAAKKGDTEGANLYQTYHVEDYHFFDIAYIFPDKDHFSGKIPEPKKINIVMALTTEIPSRLKQDAESRAIGLCWLLHLVGDIHQPLHCTTLYSNEYPDGDVGGNDRWIRDGDRATELHAYWDDLPGGIPRNAQNLPAYYKKVYQRIGENFDRLTRAEFQRDKFAAELKLTEANDWANETHKLGVGVAYESAPGVAITRKTPSHEASELRKSAPMLPPDYRAKAAATVDRQLALAGCRLADRVSAVYPK